MEHKLLGLLLQMSRLLGIAPFIRGPDYRVSRAIDICGKIALTCINFFLPLISVIAYQITILLEAQIITLAGRVLATLETINDNLEDLIPGKYPTSIPDTKPTVPRAAWENIQTIPVRLHRTNICPRDVQDKCNVDAPESNVALTLRRLAIHYFDICEIVRTITKFEGFLMILTILHHMLNLELQIASEVDQVHHKCDSRWKMERTHLTVNFLKCQIHDNKEVSNELETFLRLLLLNKTTYSPLSVCTLSRSLIVKIFGCLVTYLVIIMTYGVEVNDPTLVLANRKAFT
ncbi:uncharacterized protein LOC124534203 [Vanessa cardui]|uniref:uncharacterized protein LOC124534203 n=1 Tax=Vanessa cardui TaxID=171605 RepID=UPI001F1376D6|nr:uncharacterized protein LOC124534203 [Vanessa cardui]